MSTEEYKARITADNKDFKRKAQEVESRTKKLKDTMMKLGGALAAAFSVGKILKFISSSIKAFDTQIQAEKKLEAAVRANGEAVESTMINYKRWAAEIQRVSTVGDEATLDMLAVAQSMGVTGESAKLAVKEAIALGKAMGMNVQSAIRYTAALQAGDATMLRRYLPTLRSIEDEAEMTAKAHELLGNMFSQVTSEAQEGLGPAKQLGNAFGDMKEEIGELIISGGAWQGSMKGMKKAVEQLTTAISDFNEVQAYMADDESVTWLEKVAWKLAKFSKMGREATKDMAELIEKEYQLKKELEDGDEIVEKKLITIADYREAIKELQSNLENVTVGHRGEAKAIQDKILSYEKLIEKTLEAAEAIEAITKLSMPGGNIAPIEGKANISVGAEGVDTSGLMGGMAEDTRELTYEYSMLEEAALAAGDAMMQAAMSGKTSIKELANAALAAAKKTIGSYIAEGVAGAVKEALVSIPFPFNIALAAAAGGAAAALFNSLIPSFAEGGAAYGPTLAMVGEAAGVSSSNPEYIGTARQLAQMGAGRGGGQLTARISRNDLLFILNEGNSYSKRTY